jgi:hypothetical protein
MEKYNTIEELLDAMTTDKKTGKKLYFSDVGSSDNNYDGFKCRFNMFKDTFKRDLPELTTDEILKFHKYHRKIQDTIHSWYGFNTLLQVLEWEQLKK